MAVAQVIQRCHLTAHESEFFDHVRPNVASTANHQNIDFDDGFMNSRAPGKFTLVDCGRGTVIGGTHS